MCIQNTHACWTASSCPSQLIWVVVSASQLPGTLIQVTSGSKFQGESSFTFRKLKLLLDFTDCFELAKIIFLVWFFISLHQPVGHRNIYVVIFHIQRYTFHIYSMCTDCPLHSQHVRMSYTSVGTPASRHVQLDECTRGWLHVKYILINGLFKSPSHHVHFDKCTLTLHLYIQINAPGRLPSK